MNIAFLSRDFPPFTVGGVGTYIRDMSRLLVARGHVVHVVTRAGDNPSEYVDEGVMVHRVMPQRFRVLDIIRGRVPRFCDRIEYSSAVSRKLARLVRRYRIDIVESCEARAEGFLFFCCRRMPKLVIKLHTPEAMVYHLNGEPQSLDRYLIERLEEWWIRRADLLIGLSASITGLSSQWYGGLKVAGLVPNPVDSALFKPSAQSSDQRTVLFSGRLEFRKGVHVLVGAIPQVLSRVPDARFVFVGDDCGMKERLLRMVDELGIRSAVDFAGYKRREDMPVIYEKAAVCVVPSLWENHPYACLEAMSCARPVVASRVGGIPEIISDGNDGLLVDPGSRKQIADAIVSLLRDAEKRARMGFAARQKIEDVYAPEKVLQRNCAIYSTVIGKNEA